MLPPIFGQILMIVFSVILSTFALMMMTCYLLGIYALIKYLKGCREEKLMASAWATHFPEKQEQKECCQSTHGAE